VTPKFTLWEEEGSAWRAVWNTSLAKARRSKIWMVKRAATKEIQMFCLENESEKVSDESLD
jgi:hypothetical protein